MIAHRCGNYRPASEPTKFVENRRKRRAQPIRLASSSPGSRCISRTTRATGSRSSAKPIGTSSRRSATNGRRTRRPERRRKTGRQVLDTSGNWARMPRLMLAKCATMQALRAGWPDQFGGLYVEEELDRAKVLDLAASEIADRAREESRLNRRLPARTRSPSPSATGTLRTCRSGSSPIGSLAWIETPGRTPDEVARWADANRDPLRVFWAKSPTRCLGAEEGDRGALRGA